MTFIKTKGLFVLFIIFFLAPFARAGTSQNTSVCLDFLSKLSQSLYGDIADPLQAIREQYGEDIYSPKVKLGLYELESEILDLFQTEISHHRLTEFARKWDFTDDAALSVLIYYGTDIFEGRVRLDSKLRQLVLNKIEVIMRGRFLIYSSHPAVRRHGYYRIQVTQKSVPEMSRELSSIEGAPVSEGNVYQDLSLLRISILDSFSSPLSSLERRGLQENLHELAEVGSNDNLVSLADRLLERGISTKRTAELLGVGEQALIFVRHALHQENRGVTWARGATFEGRLLSEEAILVDLWSSDLSRAEIAKRLNQIFKTKQSNENYRTQASVQAKLSELGLTEKRGANVPLTRESDITLWFVRLKQQRHLAFSHTQYRAKRSEAMLEPAWLQGTVLNNYWENPDHIRAYLFWLGEKLGFEKPEDWYRASPSDFRDNFGGKALDSAGNSVSNIVSSNLLAPAGGWLPWKFNQTPKGWWSVRQSRKQFLDWFVREYRLTTPEAWYDVTTSQITSEGGYGLLKGTDGHLSIHDIAKEYMPQYSWLPWMFVQVEDGFWNQSKNVDQYLKWLAQQLGNTKPEDWYRIEGKDFEDTGGRKLLINHGGSPTAVVIAHVPPPADGWKPWLFARSSRGVFDNPLTAKLYLEDLFKIKNFKSANDWYEITDEDFLKNNGRTLLEKFSLSPAKVVMEFMSPPEGGWLPWKFKQQPRGIWDEKQTVLKFMEWLGSQLGIQKAEDWYAVLRKDIGDRGGAALLRRYSSFRDLIMESVSPPVGGWNPQNFRTVR